MPQLNLSFVFLNMVLFTMLTMFFMYHSILSN